MKSIGFCARERGVDGGVVVESGRTQRWRKEGGKFGGVRESENKVEVDEHSLKAWFG